jgi:hypothetical protein
LVHGVDIGKQPTSRNVAPGEAAEALGFHVPETSWSKDIVEDS